MKTFLLFKADRKPVGIGEAFLHNVVQRAVLLSFLVLLDEESILCKSARVKEQWNIELICKRSNRLHVCEGNRLA